MAAASIWACSDRTLGTQSRKTCPVLANQFVQPAVPNKVAALRITRDPEVCVPPIASNGLFPLAGPNASRLNRRCFTGYGAATCTSTNIRPTYQRLPTLDAWNLTVQRQLTNTMSLRRLHPAGTNVFAGDGNTYNANQPFIGAGKCGSHGRRFSSQLLSRGIARTAAAALQPIYLCELSRSE